MALWRSTFIFSAMTMLSRILGLVRDMVLLNVFGAGGLMDTFVVAFRIPNFFRRLFAEGAFSQAFVPVLTEYKTQKSIDEVRALISRVSGSLLAILIPLTTLATIAAPAIIYIYAPGFHGNDVKFDQAVELFRWTFPYLLFMSLTAFASSILNSYGSFASSAFSPVLLNITQISAAWLFAQHYGIITLGWSVMAAGFLQLAIQIPELWRKRLMVPPKVDFQHEGVRRILKLMLPALFGVSVTQINLLLNTVWASFMQDGSVSWLYTSERMTELPLGLIGIAIASVILPALSARHAEQNHEKFRAMIDWAARVILLVGIPASLAMFVLAEPIIQALFQHGQFGAKDVAMTTMSLQGMSGGILAFMLIKIFAPGFYARQDTKTPVRIGLMAVFANMLMNVVLISSFKLAGIQSQHVALAISSTGSAFVNAGLLYWHLHRQNIFRFESHWRKIIGQYLVSNGAMVISLLAALNFYQAHASQWLRIIELLILCAVGAGVFAVVLLLTGFRPRDLQHD